MTINTDEGVLHAPPLSYGKMPEKLMHDHTITDGAKVLYAHMHWRYGNNQRNFEGYASMAKFMDVSSAAISSRLQELEAADWIVIVPRAKFGVGRLTNVYHVFVSQKACVKWRDDNDHPKPDYSALQKRVSRAGKGNPTPHRPNPNSGSDTVVNSGSVTVVNLSSHDLDSEEYLDSNTDLDSILPNATNASAALEDEFDSDLQAAIEESRVKQAKAAAKRLTSKESEESSKKKVAVKKKAPADVPPPGEKVLEIICFILYETQDAWTTNASLIRKTYNELAAAEQALGHAPIAKEGLTKFWDWWKDPFANWRWKTTPGTRPTWKQMIELWTTTQTYKKGQSHDTTAERQVLGEKPNRWDSVKRARIPGR